MSTYREFCDANLTRAYPLEDNAGGQDRSGVFTLPTALITDLFLCAPRLPNIDPGKFYISNVLVRRYTLEVVVSYDDPATPDPIGSFRNISTTAELNTAYAFTAFERQTSLIDFRPLYFCSGQIVIGDPACVQQQLGSWNFAAPSGTDTAHSTQILATRVSLGAVNLQYLYINNTLYTGKVRLKEGANITLQVVPAQVIEGQLATVVIVNAKPVTDLSQNVNLTSDADVLAAVAANYGRPVTSLNNLKPDNAGNFTLQGVDCTNVAAVAHGLVFSNPCATPCCNEDANVTQLREDIANLNLRYAQLLANYQAMFATNDNVQRKLQVLGTGL